jgi:hypothetical protein
LIQKGNFSENGDKLIKTEEQERSGKTGRERGNIPMQEEKFEKLGKLLKGAKYT